MGGGGGERGKEGWRYARKGWGEEGEVDEEGRLNKVKLEEGKDVNMMRMEGNKWK